MSCKEDILAKLKQALSISCTDALEFSDDKTHLISAEYLITVNAAKCIAEFNKVWGTPYKIYLEHSTKIFATSCTPYFTTIPATTCFPRRISRSSQNTRRKGKIDIAIYKDKNSIGIPVCAIEVKGFNPTKPKIIDDLQRNAEYFLVSPETKKFKTLFTAFITLHSYKNTRTDKKEELNLNKLKQRYKAYIEQIKLAENISHKMDVFTVRRGTMPAYDDPHVQEHGLDGDEDYHFIGVIVYFFFQDINIASRAE